jgi:hypothetical protein
MRNLRYFAGFWLVTAFGILVSPIVGWLFDHTLRGALSALFLTLVLGVLEASLSVDNAVVNATVLRAMNALWRRRFLTWGMLIAVFGMRVLFPLLLVSALGGISPWQALILAAREPSEYARLMAGSHSALAGFGATFLLLVSLRFFLDVYKEIHWLVPIERPLIRLGRLKAAEYAVALPVIGVAAWFLPDPRPFLLAAEAGALTFLAMHLLSHWAKSSGARGIKAARAGFALFLYLEVLDASFSLDGVVGAFALTNNLFIIALGLGIGAMFVRSLTIWLVDRGALEELRYLEHGAFYAIGALAVVMLVDVFTAVPEVLTGVIGAVIITGSVLASLRERRPSRGG